MKNNSLKALMLISFLYLLQDNVQAQVTGGIGGSSPDPKMTQGATSSGLNNLYSPNLFEGSTTVNIPIHAYNQYGIALSYNTKGIRVDQCATPAGLNWNIMAEGSITRVIRDLPDELNMVTPTEIVLNNTTFVNKNRLLKGKYVTYTETAAQLAEPNVYRDGECDEFVFSCGGLSFNFSLGKEMKVFTHPHRNVKITPMIDGVAVFGVEGQPVGPWGTTQYGNQLEFLVRDEQGTQYYFVRGDYEARNMYTNEYYESEDMGTCYPTFRWVVKKITFTNGSEINYTYNDPSSGTSAGNYMQYYSKETWSGPNPVSASFLSAGMANPTQFTSQLSAIRYPNGVTATFVYDPNDKTELYAPLLKEVRIAAGGNCIRYKLNQSKINNRWFLNSIRIASCDGTLEQPYHSFEYNTLALPERLSSAQDYYGYYNGQPNGLALGSSGSGINIPVHHNQNGSLSYLNYGNTRITNSTYAQAGILTKVKNAFGGSISFAYEANQATNIFPGSTPALPAASTCYVGVDAVDGLRVATVTENEMFHPENSRISAYEYYDGQLFMPGGYFHYPDYVDSASGHWDKIVFQNMFLSPHQMANGSNHGYSKVIVKVYQNGGQLLSRKDMTFTNMKDATSNGQLRYYTNGKHFFEFPYTDKQYLKDWELGLPLELTEYDHNQRIIKKTTNYYDFSVPIENAPQAYFSNTKKNRVNSGYVIDVGTFLDPKAYYPNKKVYTDTYAPYTGVAPLNYTKTRSYVSDTRYMEDSTMYAYDARNNIKTITTRNSKGEATRTEYIYNYDVGGTSVTGGAAPGSILYNMTENGLEKMVSIEKWKPGTGSVYNQQLIDASIITYTYQGGILLSRGSYGLKGLEPMGYTAYTGLTMGSPTGSPYSKIITAFTGITPDNFDKLTEVKLNDAKGNPLETQLTDMESYKAMIWDTLSGKLIAEVANARYSEIAFSGFEASVKGNLAYDQANVVPSAPLPGGSISGNYVLRAQSSDASPLSHKGLAPGKEYTLTFWCYGGIPQFSGAGLGQITLENTYARNGWVYYTARFSPLNNTGLGFTQTGSPGSPFTYYLDDVRIFPTTGAMQTYNYTPLLGINSTTDATGRSSYYEFDQLGRRTLVRDQQGNIISKTKYYTGAGL